MNDTPPTGAKCFVPGCGAEAKIVKKGGHPYCWFHADAIVFSPIGEIGGFPVRLVGNPKGFSLIQGGKK